MNEHNNDKLVFTAPRTRQPQYRDSRTVLRITPEAYNQVEDISARTGLSLAYIASEMILYASERTEIVSGFIGSTGGTE